MKSSMTFWVRKGLSRNSTYQGHHGEDSTNVWYGLQGKVCINPLINPELEEVLLDVEVDLNNRPLTYWGRFIIFSVDTK